MEEVKRCVVVGSGAKVGLDIRRR